MGDRTSQVIEAQSKQIAVFVRFGPLFIDFVVNYIFLRQSKMGSALFAHGAVSLFERKTLLQVLGRHNCM
jgi:hypothetical protein